MDAFEDKLQENNMETCLTRQEIQRESKLQVHHNQLQFSPIRGFCIQLTYLAEEARCFEGQLGLIFPQPQERQKRKREKEEKQGAEREKRRNGEEPWNNVFTSS